MSESETSRIPTHPSIPESVSQVAPRRVMLMTPQMVAIGGLLAFFTVVFSVVILPTTTYQPPISDNWLPLSTAAFRGRGVFLSNGCVYCHSGFSRPQDVYAGLYYLYPRAAEPGDFRGVSQSPNIMGSARTGPDLSQEGGNHPDSWHVAHYTNPRSTTPISIMPSFKFLTATEIQELIAFNQSQGGKEATLRDAAIKVGNSLMSTNMGMAMGMGKAMDTGMAMDTGAGKPLTELIERLKQTGEYRPSGDSMEKSPSGLPWMAVWLVNSFERGYWLTPDPLELTQQNLIRGKAIYLERCSGCHGAQGDGKGPAAASFNLKPFDFSSASVRSDPATSSGMMYHRILTAGPGTAMENFGTRLSVEDIWRVVLFLRTIHKGGLREQLPTIEMYEEWVPPQPLLDYVAAHPLQAALQDATARSPDPFLSAARWVAPGMTAQDVVFVGGKLPMTLARLSELIKATYLESVDRSYEDTRTRGEKLPPLAQIRSTKGVQFHVP